MNKNKHIVVFLIGSFFIVSCSEKRQSNDDRSIPSEQHPSLSEDPSLSEPVLVIVDTVSVSVEVRPQEISHSNSSSNIDIESDYFQRGYDDGYQDGANLEKGRSYDNSLTVEDAREYRRGYFAGYPDGRADNDPDDEYLYGKNNADYYDTRDDDDWSEDGDFDDDDDVW